MNDVDLSGQTLTESDLLRAMATMGAETPERAVRSAVDFAAHRLDAPAGGWVVAGDPSRLKLAGLRGLAPADADRVLEQMGVLPRAEMASASDAERLADRFARIAGADRAVALHAGPALLVLGADPSAAATTIAVVRRMLDNTLERLVTVRTAERRNDKLDLSMAWTAHEVKSPLVGAMAALERARMAPHEDSAELLARVQRELEQLTDLVDDLLNWAVLGRPIQTVPTDLVSLLREAVDACAPQGGPDRVRVLAPRSAVGIQASPHHLRSALGNVIRNALLYSPPQSVVRVTVASRDGLAWVTVRDQGAGIPEEEREWIFDPFARGVDTPRGGKGLGLFITRRVVEAHGGTIWVEPADEGTTFRIQLPAPERVGGEGPG
ncbi:MAG TPA: HAMP domain-containing sensor histidine kinase [Actinomycetota bacterium]|nr:HAMP domain-containing sensor histidine kinase [Actinomycetota bacterium]